jgi:hypothetical protein
MKKSFLKFRFHSLVSSVDPWLAWLSSPLAGFVFLPGAARLCLCSRYSAVKCSIRSGLQVSGSLCVPVSLPRSAGDCLCVFFRSRGCAPANRSFSFRALGLHPVLGSSALSLQSIVSQIWNIVFFFSRFAVQGIVTLIIELLKLFSHAYSSREHQWSAEILESSNIKAEDFVFSSVRALLPAIVAARRSRRRFLSASVFRVQLLRPEMGSRSARAWFWYNLVVLTNQYKYLRVRS